MRSVVEEFSPPAGGAPTQRRFHGASGQCCDDEADEEHEQRDENFGQKRNDLCPARVVSVILLFAVATSLSGAGSDRDRENGLGMASGSASVLLLITLLCEWRQTSIRLALAT